MLRYTHFKLNLYDILQVLNDRKYGGFGRAILTIAREEGALTLYNGLFASVQRQVFYASVRIGMYEPVKNLYMDVFSGTLRFLW